MLVRPLQALLTKPFDECFTACLVVDWLPSMHMMPNAIHFDFPSDVSTGEPVHDAPYANNYCIILYPLFTCRVKHVEDACMHCIQKCR